MKNPRQIETVIEGGTYNVPTFKVTNQGIEDGFGIEIVFGDVADIAFLIHYHKEIFELAHYYNVTIMMHKPKEQWQQS
jgi:hypothetical protein